MVPLVPASRFTERPLSRFRVHREHWALSLANRRSTGLSSIAGAVWFPARLLCCPSVSLGVGNKRPPPDMPGGGMG